MDGVKFRIVAPGDVMAGMPITVSGLTRDKSFSLTVTACNDVTCRTSTPRTISMCACAIIIIIIVYLGLFIELLHRQWGMRTA